MHPDPAVEHWGSDGLFFTEAARGGSLPWRIGDVGLGGDPLGPTRHAHDGAAEYYFMFSGSALVETGGVEFVLEEGELGYIPPDAPHNFLGRASDDDACLFCVVGPNYVMNKWRIGDWLPGSEDLRMAVARPFADAGPLPAGGTLGAEAIVLEPGAAPRSVALKDQETVYLVCDGALDLALDNGLRGSVQRGTWVHLRNGQEHELASAAGCRALRFDCGFAQWAGVPLSEESPA